MILRSFGSYAHLRQNFFEKIKSILGEVNQKVFNKCQIIALLNSNSPKLLNIIVNFITTVKQYLGSWSNRR
jgi:hypothetical protein